MELLDYLDPDGRDLFDEWFTQLDPQARAKVTTHLIRLSRGNLSSVKGVGEGVLERKIDWGPGYRVYFGRDGETLIILLGGGTKASQDSDIKAAQARWRDYKQRTKK
jgi:putative addiction module killer protein